MLVSGHKLLLEQLIQVGGLDERFTPWFSFWATDHINHICACDPARRAKNQALFEDLLKQTQ
jgi:hypothetical protein